MTLYIFLLVGALQLSDRLVGAAFVVVVDVTFLLFSADLVFLLLPVALVEHMCVVFQEYNKGLKDSIHILGKTSMTN